MLETLRPFVEPIAHEALQEVGNIPGISRFCKQEHNSSFLRACRMSVITKTIMESMRVKNMTGNLVDIKKRNTSDSEPDSELDSEATSRAYAVASTFTRVVDAAEYAWLVSVGLGEKLEKVESPLRFGSFDTGLKVWNLNEIGLLSFMLLFESDVKDEVQYLTAQEKWWNDIERRIEAGPCYKVQDEE